MIQIRRRSWMCGCIFLFACSDIFGGGEGKDPLVWSIPSDGAISAPLIRGSLVFFGSLDGSVRALDRATGNARWRRTLIEGYAIRGDQIHSAGGLVLVPHYELWALDPGTGAVRWRFGGPDGAAGYRDPAIAGDTVFTASWGGWASSLDASNGEAFWTVDLGESAFDPVTTDELVIYGTRSFFSEREGPYGAGHLVALRRSDGSEAWRFPLPDSTGFPRSGGAVNGGVVWQDRVIVGSMAAWVYAIRIEDGSLIWKAPNGEGPGGAGFTSRPVLVGDVVVFGRQNSQVEAWDVHGGGRVWTWDVPSGVTDLVARGPYVYSTQGFIVIGDAGGEVHWRFGASGYFRGNVAEDGMIYALYAGPMLGHGTFIQAIRPPISP